LEEDVMLDGVLVEKGACMSVYTNVLHRNPHIWEEPSKFKPERFHPK
jgi:cytochrome P450